tara:strand:+ start:244 stop:498 length:255 start_codon:yes stop_codon:yes gene_type:complete
MEIIKMIDKNNQVPNKTAILYEIIKDGESAMISKLKKRLDEKFLKDYAGYYNVRNTTNSVSNLVIKLKDDGFLKEINGRWIKVR